MSVFALGKGLLLVAGPSHSETGGTVLVDKRSIPLSEQGLQSLRDRTRFFDLSVMAGDSNSASAWIQQVPELVAPDPTTVTVISEGI